VETDRRVWSKPQLVVLVRSRPEESVLDYCKMYGNVLKPLDIAGGCWGEELRHGTCAGFCYADAAS
jgi:hypothetical protein